MLADVLTSMKVGASGFGEELTVAMCNSKDVSLGDAQMVACDTARVNDIRDPQGVGFSKPRSAKCHLRRDSVAIHRRPVRGPFR